ncbi:hypothetical protein V6N11_019580 [Hibiscus sabdariffa]|uniref:Uncharacterized protein n=1 Tax=Hibiscus sabdariffa TaxID=183260 RepID=A0ABR2NLG9_9ROSI
MACGRPPEVVISDSAPISLERPSSLVAVADQRVAKKGRTKDASMPVDGSLGACATEGPFEGITGDGSATIANTDGLPSGVVMGSESHLQTGLAQNKTARMSFRDIMDSGRRRKAPTRKESAGVGGYNDRSTGSKFAGVSNSIDVDTVEEEVGRNAVSNKVVTNVLVSSLARVVAVI